MECNSNPVLPSDATLSGQSGSGHMFHGGPSFNMIRPPPFWGPPPPFQGYGPRPYPFPPHPHFTRGPPVFCVPPPCLRPFQVSSVLVSKTEDEAWLNNWLQSRLSHQHIPSSVRHQGLTISRAQEKLKHCFDVLKDLEERHSQLQEEMGTMPETQWNDELAIIEEKKSIVSNLMETVFSEKSLADLQNQILKRRRKRTRLRRQHGKQRKDAYLRLLRRQALHQKADAWLTDRQKAVEKTRKDEEMKKEADAVLAEVTRHQADGRRQIALLEALQKLHQARLQSLERCGSKLSAEDKKDSEHSALVFSRLLAMWSDKMDVYSKEEHGLRVMLEESAARKGDLEIQNVSRTIKKWEMCLFGAENSSTEDEPCDINTLVSIRYAWDQYLVPKGVVVPMASTIPVGWVLPTTPSSSEWQNLLASES